MQGRLVGIIDVVDELKELNFNIIQADGTLWQICTALERIADALENDSIVTSIRIEDEDEDEIAKMEAADDALLQELNNV